MATVSPLIDERARKNLATILRALASVTQVRVAELMGVHESSISRLKQEDFTRMAAILAACGLKAVPEDQEVWEPGYLESLRHLLAIELKRRHVTSDFTPLGD